MVRGVLFDLFHTLTGVESEWSELPWTSDVLGIDRAAWDSALTSSSRWRLAGQVRDPLKIVATLARKLRPSISDDVIARAVDVRTQRFRQALERIPEENVAMIQTLRRSGVRTALISNADAMEVAGWPSSPLAGLFDVEVFSCEVGWVKPEPEIYEHALTEIGLDASECVFVGDGGSDELEGARAVGLQTVFVSGIIAQIWPDRVEKRGAAAAHRIHRAADLLKLPLFDGTA